MNARNVNDKKDIEQAVRPDSHTTSSATRAAGQLRRSVEGAARKINQRQDDSLYAHSNHLLRGIIDFIILPSLVKR